MAAGSVGLASSVITAHRNFVNELASMSVQSLQGLLEDDQWLVAAAPVATRRMTTARCCRLCASAEPA